MSVAASVLVVGSLHLDLVVDAPDRPRKGETVVGRSLSRKCGGKGGNQAVAARLAGATTAFVGAVGDDLFGDALLSGLKRSGVDCSGVAIHAGRSSGVSVAIFDDEGDYGAVIVSGTNLLIDPAQLAAGRFVSGGVLVLQNEIPESINLRAAEAAREAGMPVVLNAAPARPFETALPELVDILVVNALEAEMLGGGVVDTLDHASRAATSLVGRFPAVLVTAGGAGLAWADRGGARHDIAAVPVQVRSTHGAGDCFVGTFAAALSHGAAIPEALDRANRAAAVLVATPESERTGW